MHNLLFIFRPGRGFLLTQKNEQKAFLAIYGNDILHQGADALLVTDGFNGGGHFLGGIIGKASKFVAKIETKAEKL